MSKAMTAMVVASRLATVPRTVCHCAFNVPRDRQDSAPGVGNRSSKPPPIPFESPWRYLVKSALERASSCRGPGVHHPVRQPNRAAAAPGCDRLGSQALLL